MICPNCGGQNCHIINEVHESGRDYYGGRGCLGYLIFGPIGLLCGLCGKGRETRNTNYWVCNNCGNKWKV